MTTVIITINDHEIRGTCNATATTPEFERRCASIIMAAMDAVAVAMNHGGEAHAAVKSLIQPTILLRMKEAHLPIGSEL